MNPVFLKDVVLMVLKYGAFVVLGYVICMWTYATPRISTLEKNVAEIQEANAEASAKFEADAARKLKEQQDATTEATKRYLDIDEQLRKRAAADDVRIGMLNKAVDAFARSNSCQLPATATAPIGSDDRALVLGQLLQESNNLLAEGRQSADAAANQIHALQNTLTGVTQ